MPPKTYIIALIQSVTELANVRYCKSRTKISTDSPDAIPLTIILHKGSVELYRAKDHLLMKNVEAPAVFGINFVFDDVSKIYLMANSDSQYEILKRSQLEDAVRRNNLWEKHAYLQMYNAHRLTEAHFSLVGSSSYESLCTSLIDLMNESEHIRNSITAGDYIQRKTSLSRSGVMKMLGDLKLGGYIEMDRGKLVHIVHLPKAY